MTSATAVAGICKQIIDRTRELVAKIYAAVPASSVTVTAACITAATSIAHIINLCGKYSAFRRII